MIYQKDWFTKVAHMVTKARGHPKVTGSSKGQEAGESGHNDRVTGGRQEVICSESQTTSIMWAAL